MRIAYLTNQYPLVRHTFIRRELVAVESQGFHIARFSIRRVRPEFVVDPADRKEQELTRAFWTSEFSDSSPRSCEPHSGHPLRLACALWLATQMGRSSHRGMLRNWVYLAEACCLVRFLLADRIEHLHVHFGTNPAAVAFLTRVLGGPPYSLTIHGAEEWDRPEALHLREKYENAAFVTSVSEFGRAQVMRGAPTATGTMSTSSAAGSIIPTLPAPAPCPTTAVSSPSVALVEAKGQLVLLRAVKRLRDQGQLVDIVLVGDGPLLRDARARDPPHGVERSGEDHRMAVQRRRAGADCRRPRHGPVELQ